MATNDQVTLTYRPADFSGHSRTLRKLEAAARAGNVAVQVNQSGPVYRRIELLIKGSDQAVDKFIKVARDMLHGNDNLIESRTTEGITTARFTYRCGIFARKSCERELREFGEKLGVSVRTQGGGGFFFRRVGVLITGTDQDVDEFVDQGFDWFGRYASGV